MDQGAAGVEVIRAISRDFDMKILYMFLRKSFSPMALRMMIPVLALVSFCEMQVSSKTELEYDA